MSDNPLEPSKTRDAKIKTKARELWEADGKPGCGADAYLEQAGDLVGMEENPTAGEIPVSDLPPPELAGVQVEDARIQENLGDFPERLTDQGDHDHFPEKENERDA